MQKDLQEALCKLNEKEFTEHVVSPVIAKLHPGKIEYSHSGLEAGRDVVSFGIDSLRRSHVLCVQVKSSKFSFGAPEFGRLVSVLQVARREGVTLHDGSRVIPNEVWMIAPHPFPEQKRRQVSDSLAELQRNNIKIVAGDEFCDLLVQILPELANRFINEDSTADLITHLSRHNEARAFGLSEDRSIEDFYVTSNLAPGAKLAYAALSQIIVVSNYRCHAILNNKDLVQVRVQPSQSKKDEKLRDVVLKTLQLDSFVKDFEVNNSVTYDENTLNDDPVDIEVQLNMRDAAQKLISSVRQDMKHCPRSFGINPEAVAKTCTSFRLLERFLSILDKRFGLVKERLSLLEDETAKRIGYSGASTLDGSLEFGNSGDISSVQSSFEPRGLRIAIPNPTDLLRASNHILIEGPPGCGKTTLLKILAIQLLKAKRNVHYLPCHTVLPAFRGRTLDEIVYHFGLGAKGKDSTNGNSILIADGLDEGAFDMSDKLLCANQFSYMVVSARTAFETKLRLECFHIALAPFNDLERNCFFERWFRDRGDLIGESRQIIARYADVNLHTRLPLIATITASLIEGGMAPKTRAEIYQNRLDLLLSKWDKLRGVRRSAVDEPGAKRRFLQLLAYSVHNGRGSRRIFDEEFVLNVYEQALGAWGYEVQFENVFGDLIIANGILTKEREDAYSFGHLSFQEHLAGEYMARCFDQEQICKRLKKYWWKEPINFWASIKGDITDLIEFLLDREMIPVHAEQLKDMLRYAPFTSPGAKECVLDSLTWMKAESRKRG